jgi:hypothetical protein
MMKSVSTQYDWIANTQIRENKWRSRSNGRAIRKVKVMNGRREQREGRRMDDPAIQRYQCSAQDSLAWQLRVFSKPLSMRIPRRHPSCTNAHNRRDIRRE